MGASRWSYFVVHDNDVAEAFARLQQDVFSRGEFYSHPKGEFRSLEQLREAQAEEGTHSIIDMLRVTAEPAGEPDPRQELLAAVFGGATSYGTIYRMSDAELETCFSTNRPTRSIIEANESKVYARLRRGYGRYTPVFESTSPVGLYFAGVSGD
jgi:hypothetical protein